MGCREGGAPEQLPPGAGPGTRALPADTTTASWEFDDEGSDEPRTLTLSATGPDWEPARWEQLRAALEATLKSFSNPEGQP